MRIKSGRSGSRWRLEAVARGKEQPRRRRRPGVEDGKEVVSPQPIEARPAGQLHSWLAPRLPISRVRPLLAHQAASLWCCRYHTVLTTYHIHRFGCETTVFGNRWTAFHLSVVEAASDRTDVALPACPNEGHACHSCSRASHSRMSAHSLPARRASARGPISLIFSSWTLDDALNVYGRGLRVRRQVGGEIYTIHAEHAHLP